ncbi:SDR family oxidoreductase [bacterium]|nr:SDR family oxidoreductase [bacterium]
MKLKYPNYPVALVTGSGRRLGRKIAVALAKNGFDIVINYNSADSGAKKAVDEIHSLGRKCICIKADVSKKLQVQKMFRSLYTKFGRLDLLVNNAAIFPKAFVLEKTPEEVWDQVIDINLKGTFLCAQEAAKIMLKQKSGHIINLASLGGYLAWTQHIPYNVSKAGVIMLTKSMAKALAPDIRVNAVAPGTIIIPNEETGIDHQPSIERIPLKKYGKPSDITDMIIFLAHSSDYITGQVFSIDGGVTVL